MFLVTVTTPKYLFQVIFKADTLFANKMALLKMSHQRMLKKLRKPVDKEE